MGIFSRKKDDKKKADFSNVQSGSSSTAPDARAVGQPPEQVAGTAGQARTYVVAKGDSLFVTDTSQRLRSLNRR